MCWMARPCLRAVRRRIPFEELKQYLPDAAEEKYQTRIKAGEEEYVLTCENVKQEDTSDYFQVVSVRAVDEILREAYAQQRKSIWLFLGSVVLAGTLIFAFFLVVCKACRQIPGTDAESV